MSMLASSILIAAAVARSSPIALDGAAVEPKADGGYSIYDYESNAYIDVKPTGDGGYSIYDYGTATYTYLWPIGNGAFRIYDYATDTFADVRPRRDGTYAIQQRLGAAQPGQRRAA